MTVQIDLDDLAMELVKTVDRGTILRLIRDIDGLVADEDFTLKLARWAKREEERILVDRIAGEVPG